MTLKEKRLEASRDEWKTKNKARYEETKALKMRLKETAESRDRWKTVANERERALMEKEKNENEMERIMTSLKHELENLKKNKRY